MTLIDHIFLRVPKNDIDKPVYYGNLYSKLRIIYLTLLFGHVKSCLNYNVH